MAENNTNKSTLLESLVMYIFSKIKKNFQSKSMKVLNIIDEVENIITNDTPSVDSKEVNGVKVNKSKIFNENKMQRIKILAISIPILFILVIIFASIGVKGFFGFLFMGALILMIRNIWLIFRLLTLGFKIKEKRAILDKFFLEEMSDNNEDNSIIKLGEILNVKHTNVNNIIGDVYLIYNSKNIYSNKIYLFIYNPKIETITYQNQIDYRSFVQFNTHISGQDEIKIKISETESDIRLIKRDQLNVKERTQRNHRANKGGVSGMAAGVSSMFESTSDANAVNREKQRLREEEKKYRILNIELKGGDKFLVQHVDKEVCRVEKLINSADKSSALN